MQHFWTPIISWKKIYTSSRTLPDRNHTTLAKKPKKKNILKHIFFYFHIQRRSSGDIWQLSDLTAKVCPDKITPRQRSTTKTHLRLLSRCNRLLLFLFEFVYFFRMITKHTSTFGYSARTIRTSFRPTPVIIRPYPRYDKQTNKDSERKWVVGSFLCAFERFLLHFYLFVWSD